MCLREASRRHKLTVVGIRVYSAEKENLDGSELADLEGLCGVRATRDVSRLLQIDCDCVVYLGRDWGDDSTLDEIVEILSAGHNVITPLPYHGRSHSSVAYRAITRACSRGNSTFHATGVNPDVIGGAILPALAQLCVEVNKIELTEVWRCHHASKDELSRYGFGLPPTDSLRSSPTYTDSIQFLRGICRRAADQFGFVTDTFRESHTHLVATEDVWTEHLHIPIGTLAGTIHRLHILEADSAQEVFVVETAWLADPALCVAGLSAETHWAVRITGTPDVEVSIALTDNSGARFLRRNLDCGVDYVATLAPCLNRIRTVADALPGIF